MHVWVCSESFIVDLSGELAESVIHIYQYDLERPVILVLTSMKIQMCEGWIIIFICHNHIHI